MLFLIFISTFATEVGCSRSASRPASNLQKSFGLRLNWPGEPHESSQAIPSEEGEYKNYTGLFTEKGTDGVLIFAASVMEFPDKVLSQSNPRDLLQAAALPLQKNEITRNEIEHGPKKYQGFDIRGRSGKSFARHLIVMAGPRIYTVSVTSHTEALLESAKVQEFFESFGINE